ncbi:hypothetical protein D3C85_1272150 [compost metagenome]
MGIKRTKRIRSIDIVAVTVAGYNINRPTKGIRPQPHWYYTFVHFNPVCNINRDIVDLKRRTKIIHRYPVYKIPYVVARKTI